MSSNIIYIIIIIDVRSPKNETFLTIANEIKETLKKRRLFDKCIFFPGDTGNCNTNFVGIRRRRENNVSTHLKSEVRALIDVGCLAHILNNGVNQMILDLENIIYKTYQHFSIHTVRTEELKDYWGTCKYYTSRMEPHGATLYIQILQERCGDPLN